MIKTTVKRGLIGLAATGLSLACLGGVASAETAPTATMPSTEVYKANLRELNGSGASGTAYITVTGDQATVAIYSTGTSAGLPHAQHIHLGESKGSCPTKAADADHDGFISVAEAAGNYGPIAVSLTETGDISPASALAVDRFPVGHNDGSLSYSRSFKLPEGVTAANIANAEIVQHGISKLFDDRNAYDGSKISSIDPTLPFEATVPADCGVFKLVFSSNPAGQSHQGTGNNNQGDGNSYGDHGKDMSKEHTQTNTTSNSTVELNANNDQSATSGDASTSDSNDAYSESGSAMNSSESESNINVSN